MKTRVTRLRLGKGDKKNEWCEIQVELRDTDKGPELSICGAAGHVLTVAQAKREALDYWTSFFEESPGEIIEMNKRFGKRFTSARGAARFVLASDGDLHGIDVHMQTCGQVYVTTSCGQIREEIAEYFPEAIPFFKWHLNGMRVSPERTEEVSDAHGRTSTRVIPRGAAWDYEPLPEHVIAWVREMRAGIDSGAISVNAAGIET